MKIITHLFLLPVSVACLTCSVAVAAQGANRGVRESTQSPVSRAQIDELKRASADPLQVELDPSTGGIRKLVGRFKPETQSVGREEQARGFLARHAASLRIAPDLADLKVAGRSDDAGGEVMRFEQLHDGVAVVEGLVLVGFDPGGDIVYVRNGYLPDLDVPAAPVVSEQEALAIAETALGATLPNSRLVRLVVVRGGKGWPGHYLAWEISAALDRPRGDWRVSVDSQTGAVVQWLNLMKQAGPTCVPCDPASDSQCALVFARNPVDFFNITGLTAASNVDAAQVGCRLDNLTSGTDLTGLYVNTSDTPTPRAAPPYSSLRSVNERAVDEATAYYHVNRSKEYLDLLGFPDVMDFSIPVNAADTSVPNAAHYVSSERRIGLGIGVGGVDFAQDADVVYHELMHAIQDDQVPGFGTSSESGAVGEGTADYWAAGLTDDAFTASGPACVAAWASAGFGACLRRVDGTKQFPGNMIFELHADGEIYSSFLWSLRQTLGGEVVDRLALKSHTFLPPNADFIDAADALLAADVTLYGGANAAVIHGAAKARGIPRTGMPASSVGLAGTEVFNCETAHPYGNLAYQECRFVKPGATRLRVHFSMFDTEDHNDFVYISDGDYRQVQRLSGTPFASSSLAFSAAVSGDTVVVRFKADTSVNRLGFTVDTVWYDLDPRIAVDNLITQVLALHLDKNTEKSLVSLLRNVQADLAKNKTADAAAKLNSFIAQVNAQRGKKITPSAADALIAATNLIIAAINAGP